MKIKLASEQDLWLKECQQQLLLGILPAEDWHIRMQCLCVSFSCDQLKAEH